MLTALVEVNRTEAIRRGIALQGRHVVPISAEQLATLSTEERAMLAGISPSANEHGYARALHTWGTSFEAVHEALTGLAEVARKQREETESLRQQQEERTRERNEKDLAEVLALPENELIRQNYSGDFVVAEQLARLLGVYPDHKDLLARHEIAKARAETRNQELTEARARTIRESEEKKARKAATWDAFVAFFLPGQSASVQERHGAGVLPRDEFRDLVRTWLFDSFKDYALFTKITKKDVNHDPDYCSGSDVNIEVDNLDEMDAEEFELYKQFDALLKETVISLHQIPGVAEVESDIEPEKVTATCSSCGAEVGAHCVLVTIVLGSQTFSQKYSL